ncbi:transcription factor LHW [Neltuma alba]|uniref:transcription factor LHW n=1 Tax=Neltuma alba TaxID=207710 RepID=UPI0010A3C445|nr:transcription factor LHW-like [Prosopis alba]
MGLLLKEALKTFCGRNQWSYAVFWKIGCHNPKLLIWEECYYEPLPCPFPPNIDRTGTSNLSFGAVEGDRVCSLINRMMVNNSVNIAGEGIIGRAAFTGNHQWIVLNNFPRAAYPPEVYNEVHHQFSAGMQTIVVIPVLPHGVVQLGSFLAIMEDVGFVNDVRSLILQLGCVPGVLLSEDYSTKVSANSLGAAVNVGVPVSVDPPVVTSNCSPSVASGSNQQRNSSHTSNSIVHQSLPRGEEINNDQVSVLTHQTPNLTQMLSKYHDNLCQPKSITLNKPNFTGPSDNRVVEAQVIPSNLKSCPQQPGLCDSRTALNELNGVDQSSLSDRSMKLNEQQTLLGSAHQNYVDSLINVPSNFSMTQMKTDRGHMPDRCQSSVSTPLLGGIPIHGGMSSLLRSSLINTSISEPPKVGTADFSGTQKVGTGVQRDDSTRARAFSHPYVTSQLDTCHRPLESSDWKNLPLDLKCARDKFGPNDQMIDSDLLQALKIPSLRLEEHVPASDQIMGFSNGSLDNDFTSQAFTEREAYAQSSSGDDLFDVLGVGFKNKILNENWNKFLPDESDGDARVLDKKAACMNMQGVDADCYSVNETVSDSGIFSGRGTDHLLDAVVSRAQSAVKQDSDDMSCRTTVTRISSAFVPSSSYRQVMSDHALGGLLNFPKTEGKLSAAETCSLGSGYHKDDAGDCSQTTSIYGSQLSSWVENVSNVKRENSVATGYSKRPDEAGKSNRKRLKPGENPRPRPKDRQMIQDRVKELREIVPNGAKCSIDALLERTIKHMLFLQSVTKHADKLKQTEDSKTINKEGGLVLKDNFEGGATWAYEIGSQSMVCPIIVEDLNPPRQMLVEMLCEERGFFLEIADLIRGMGLTILKGVMEAQNDKIWARFAVEANRDVTRMEIFMSLVHLLEQAAKGNGASTSNEINNMMVYHSFPQPSQIPATGGPSSLQ